MRGHGWPLPPAKEYDMDYEMVAVSVLIMLVFVVGYWLGDYLADKD